MAKRCVYTGSTAGRGMVYTCMWYTRCITNRHLYSPHAWLTWHACVHLCKHVDKVLTNWHHTFLWLHRKTKIFVKEFKLRACVVWKRNWAFVLIDKLASLGNITSGPWHHSKVVALPDSFIYCPRDVVPQLDTDQLFVLRITIRYPGLISTFAFKIRKKPVCLTRCSCKCVPCPMHNNSPSFPS